ncbi:MAG: hypothetical protein UZ22_OP11002000106 [Microgenomates bacterium OLB23]|nr:MAG: hypothetical protein UZ22_OP11002000106 [Microgenomates bacterium OLB23]
MARTSGIVRLVKKNAGIWQGKVHEMFKAEMPVGALQEPLQHIPHESLAGFIEKINYYSSLRAEELFAQKHPTNVLEILVYPLGKFAFSFFALMGYKDRERGFIYSFMMSFHSFLVRSKLYLLQHKN